MNIDPGISLSCQLQIFVYANPVIYFGYFMRLTKFMHSDFQPMRRRAIILTLIFFLTLSACGSKIPINESEKIPSITSTPRPVDLTATLNMSDTATSIYHGTQETNLTSTAQVKATNLALITPTKTQTSTLTITPTTDFSKFSDQWSEYTSDEHGISFEYPAVYEVSPYIDLGCGPRINTQSGNIEIDIGERIILTIFKNNGQSLDAYVEDTIKKSEQLTITSKNNIVVDEVNAIMIEYRFGGPNRYGTFTVFSRNGYFYRVDFTAGGTCDLAVSMVDKGSGMTEFETYFKILESFKFTQ